MTCQPGPACTGAAPALCEGAGLSFSHPHQPVGAAPVTERSEKPVFYTGMERICEIKHTTGTEVLPLGWMQDSTQRSKSTKEPSFIYIKTL